MGSLSIIFAGSGEFGLPTLRALVESSHRVVQIISQPDRPSGRGRHLTATAVSQFALEKKLPLVRTENINAESFPAADLLVVIAFGQKVGPAVVDHPRLGSVNLHASLLPKYRGAAPINWAIMNGETVTGNSVIRLAQRMDAGAILGQSQASIGETETAGELHDRLAADGAGLVMRVLSELQSGTAREANQDESKATAAPKLTQEAARIDWSSAANQIANQIRGLYPWPGCRVRIVDETGVERDRLTLVRAVMRTGAAPLGTINDSGAVGADDGVVEILELQPEGKRAMSLSSYRNGHAWEAGMRLESIA